MIRWGLLGTAHINRRVIPAMRQARRSQLVAVASRVADRARAYAAEWQIPTAHASYDALLRDADVDAIYLPLPNSLHVEWTLRALDAGKHVLCEKPLALSPDDVDRIAAVAGARERVVAEAFMYRHEPLTARVLQLVRAETIGPVTMMSSVFTYEQARSNDVRLDPRLGGGSLWDIGCYCVNAVRLIANQEPSEAFGWASPAPSGVDQRFTGLLRFPDGCTAVVHSSFRSRYRTALEISGTTGVMRVANIFRPASPTEIEIVRDGRPEIVAVEASPALFVREIEDFVAAALEGRPPAVTLRDSRGNAAALAALYASARTGRSVSI
jgi:D-xylose 1-dehydrogenase (NADP+, D-xylono-1,5-lactone-forming)